jgi:hypothetical protein
MLCRILNPAQHLDLHKNKESPIEPVIYLSIKTLHKLLNFL